jgi:DNA adenine methylase
MSVNVKPKPIVKWTGSKRQLESTLLNVFKQSNWNSQEGTYFEPFFGGGSMFFALEPSRAKVSDLNPALIELYRAVRGPIVEFTEAASSLQDDYNSRGAKEQQELFVAVKEQFNRNKFKFSESNSGNNVDLKLALDFLFLNKTGFNGMYRENSSGVYNIPFGHRKTVKLVDGDNFSNVHSLLRDVEPVCGDYRQIIDGESVSEGDLIYFDPPYSPAGDSATFSSYHKSGFNPQDHILLAQRAGELISSGARVVISNSHNAHMAEEYQKQNLYVYEVEVHRLISGKSHGRGIVKEIIATSFEVKGLSHFEIGQ